MKREFHRWYSHRLGMELGVVVYGHWGSPLLGFPTSAGDEWELEGQSLISSLADFIDGGKLKFFTINSINGLSFYNKGAHPFHRSYVQSMFDSYLREEVVPFIWDNCQSQGIAISTMGASFGAYHAANSLFKHPDVIKRCFALSGVYDLKNFMDGMFDKPENLGIRKGWSGAMMGMMTLVRVLPPDLYDKVVSGKGDVQPGASVPGAASGGKHEGHKH